MDNYNFQIKIIDNMKFTTQALLFTNLSTILARYHNDYKLKMNENNTFKIMQITDIHYGEND